MFVPPIRNEAYASAIRREVTTLQMYTFTYNQQTIFTTFFCLKEKKRLTYTVGVCQTAMGIVQCLPTYF